MVEVKSPESEMRQGSYPTQHWVGLSRRESFLCAFGVGMEVFFHEMPVELLLQDGGVLG